MWEPHVDYVINTDNIRMTCYFSVRSIAKGNASLKKKKVLS